MRQTAIYPDLAGRTVFVTGGGSGIGAAITEGFCAQNSKVAFVDIAERDSRALARAIAKRTGHAPLFLRCDIRDVDALGDAISRTRKQLGDISVLVNNAANDARHWVAEIDVAAWDDKMALNLRPMFFSAQAVTPQMKRLGGGSIVNFGSSSWMLAAPQLSVYATAKAGVHGLTRSLARELGPHRIRVNTVVPGWVLTKRQMKLWMTPARDKWRRTTQCIDMRVLPEHAADMVLFLASDAAIACTGQNFLVDAGLA